MPSDPRFRRDRRSAGQALAGFPGPAVRTDRPVRYGTALIGGSLSARYRFRHRGIAAVASGRRRLRINLAGTIIARGLIAARQTGGAVSVATASSSAPLGESFVRASATAAVFAASYCDGEHPVARSPSPSCHPGTGRRPAPARAGGQSCSIAATWSRVRMRAYIFIALSRL